MSDLEAAASPILVPMIEGKARGLGIAQQALVSRWASKTAMVWDQLVPDQHRLYDDAEHRWVMKNATPPPDTSVRLGHSTGSEAEFIEHKRAALFWELPPDSEDRIRPDAHRTLMVIGELVIEVAVRRPVDSLKPPAGIDIDDLLMLVWPTAQPRSWPPRLGMTDKTLESLHTPEEPD